MRTVRLFFGLSLMALTAANTAAAASPTASSVALPSTAPGSSEVAPGIMAWTPYTSPVYGITFGYPDGWTLYSAATRAWQEGATDGDRSSETFMNPELRDGDQIALGVWRQPVGTGDDITSREGLAAWFEAHRCDDQVDACETVSDIAVPMCVGHVACLPAVLMPLSDSTQAVFADPGSDLITIVSLGRPDDFPAAARYGGAVRLLESILATMDVWPPEPGQIAAGS